MFKGNNKDTRMKTRIKIQDGNSGRSEVFIVNFEHVIVSWVVVSKYIETRLKKVALKGVYLMLRHRACRLVMWFIPVQSLNYRTKPGKLFQV